MPSLCISRYRNVGVKLTIAGHIVQPTRCGDVPYDCLGRSFEVVVLHTTNPETLVALKTAASLAKGLASRIRLLVLQVVPYPLPIETPDVELTFTHRRFRTVAADISIETNVDIRLGRDKQWMLQSALKPQSLVVMGGRHSWFSKPARMAKRLQKLGHQVVFAQEE